MSGTATDAALPVEEFKGSNMVELLQWRAERQPDRIVFTELADDGTPAGTLTLRELDCRARAIAFRISERAKPGDRALLVYTGGLDFVEAFFGCLYAGVIAAPVYPPDPSRFARTIPRFDAMAGDAQVSLVLTTRGIASLRARLAALSRNLQTTEWIATDEVDTHLALSWREPPPPTDALALLQYTSGSTSTPKGVKVSHGNLFANEKMIYQAFGLHSDVVGVSWLPVFHDMGLIGHVVQPVFSGSHNVLMSPLAFVQRPSRWLRAITEYRATVCGAPNFAYEFCTRKMTPEEREGLDLSSWDLAYCGAEPIDSDTLERFIETFGPHGFRREALFPCYGLAEATLIVSGGAKYEPFVVRDVDARALERHRVAPAAEGPARRLVGCGRTLLDQEIAIVDPAQRTPCPEGEIGEIWVRGSNVAQGYWSWQASEPDPFRSTLAGSGDGPFLRTGDLGFVIDGELFVTGRLKDVMIIRGLNYYPQDIEHTVARSHPALRPGSCAAFSIPVGGEDQVAVVQELRRGYEDADLRGIVGSIRKAVAAEHQIRLEAAVLIDAGTIPKTSSGKIRRNECRELLKRGEFSERYRWLRRAASVAQGAEAQ